MFPLAGEVGTALGRVANVVGEIVLDAGPTEPVGKGWTGETPTGERTELICYI